MVELTVKVPLGGREIEMRKPSDGALVVMARITRSLPKDMIENDDVKQETRDKLVRNLGTLGQIVESMIVTDDDKSWLDDVMIDGSVSAEDVFDSIRAAGEKFGGTQNAGPVAKKAPVRRRAR